MTDRRTEIATASGPVTGGRGSATHSGTRPGDPLAALIGQSIPYTSAQIASRYPDASAYLREWDAAVDRARGQGLVLDADLEELRQRGRKAAAGLWR